MTLGSRSVVLLAALSAVAGCNKGQGVVVVTVTADPAISNVATLHAHAQAGSRTVEFDVPAGVGAATRVSIPPSLTFAIVVPLSVGASLSVTVTAKDGTGSTLASGTAQTAVRAGSRGDVTVTLSNQPTMGDGGMPVADMAIPLVAPRLIAPLSTATVTSKQPRLQWVAPSTFTAPSVDICTTTTCTVSAVLSTIDSSGTSAVPNAPLDVGHYFWRVRGMQSGSPASTPFWEFFVGKRSADAAVDTSWGTTLDFDADGLVDVLVGAINGGSGNGGVTYAFHGSATGLVATSPVILSAGTAMMSLFGQPVASAGDVNGDGLPDVLIGAPHSVDSQNNFQAGRAYLFLSNGGTIGATPTVLEGPDGAGGAFGGAIAAAGDINADGFGDIVVAAPGSGHVYLYYGSSTGISPSAGMALPVPTGLSAGAFGSAIAAADIDGNGASDLVIGANQATDSQNHANAGQAFVYFNQGGSLSSSPLLIESTTDGAGSQFGSSISCTGDLNGDGAADIVIGAPLAGNGIVHVFYGKRGSMGVGSKVDLASPDGAAKFGSAVSSSGDLNGDGYADLVIGTPSSAAHVYFGGAGMISNTGRIDLPNVDSAGSTFANSVVIAGDIDGNGYADLIVGNFFAKVGTTFGQGMGHVYYGDAAGLNMGRARLDFTSPTSESGQFGSAVAQASPLRKWICRMRRGRC